MNCKFKEIKTSLPIFNMGIAQSQLYLSSFYIICSVHFQIPLLVCSLVFLWKKSLYYLIVFSLPPTNSLDNFNQTSVKGRGLKDFQELCKENCWESYKERPNIALTERLQHQHSSITRQQQINKLTWQRQLPRCHYLKDYLLILPEIATETHQKGTERSNTAMNLSLLEHVWSPK